MIKFNPKITGALVAAAVSFSPLLAETDTSKVLVKVDGKPITQLQFDRVITTLPPQILEKNTDSEKLKKEILDQMVGLTVLMNTAEKSDLKNKPDVAEAMKTASLQPLLQAYVADKIGKLVTPDRREKEYKEIKEKVKDKKERKISHILFDSEATAKKAIEKIDGGQDFKKIAREESIDKESAKEGGSLGYMIEGGFVPEFEKAAAALEVGKYTKTPVKTQFGYHVIKLEDVRPVQAPKLSEITQQIDAVIQQKEMVNLVEELKKGAKIETVNAPTLTLPKTPTAVPAA